LACEKLAGVHLLLHGIWAFKVHAAGERTDLVFPQPSRLELAGDVRSTLTRMTLQRGARECLGTAHPSCRQLARSPPQVIRSGVNDGKHPRQRVQN
jgi:hypothetical protein